jgi:hypothetical protein
VIGGFVYTGTLGCVVRDNVSGNRMLLSNFHVMCVDTGWAVGNTMAQPSRVDTGSCPADVVGTLQRAVLSANVDGAIASHDARGIQCSIEDIGSVTGSAAAALGTHVRKRGRTTGLTHGDIDSISLTVSVDYGDGIGVRTLTNQIGIAVDTSQSTEFGKKGDSGSVIVDDSRRVLGLYFAGSLDGTHGVANPIAAVLSELNISLCVPKRFEKFPKLEKLEFKEHKLEFKERFPDKLLLPEKWRTREKFWVEHKLVERPEIPDLPFDPRDPIGPGIGPRGAADDVGDKPQEAKLAETKAQDKLRDKPILADHKAYKEKHEKLEKFEKIEKPERKELKHEKLEKEKLEKLEKPERKELKHEKLEWKELKHELKELKLEKLELEGPRKDLEIPGPDPYGPEQPGFDQWGMGGYGYGYGDEQHFIGEDLRPDLGEGALGGEEDLY